MPTAPNYVDSIEGVISKYGLDRFDRLAIQTANQKVFP